MNASLGRRSFLATCGTAALAASPFSLGPRAAQAIEPIRRHPAPRFKFSLAAYSYRELLTGEKAQLTLDHFVDDCAKFGLEGAELTSYYFPQPLTSEYLKNLAARCFRQGLDVSGTAIGNDFGHLEPEKHAAQIAATKKWIDHAQTLGAPVIRIFAGQVRGPDEAASRRQMVAAIEECCAYAGERGIYLALENHGGPTATAEGLLAFVEAVKSPWFGVNLDTGNFHSSDVYAELTRLAPYALNVQVKVVVSGPDKRKVPTDFARLAGILRGCNYRGYVVLEYEEAGDPRRECPKYFDQLRAALAN